MVRRLVDGGVLVVGCRKPRPTALTFAPAGAGDAPTREIRRSTVQQVT
jgi:hypothetical protein